MFSVFNSPTFGVILIIATPVIETARTLSTFTTINKLFNCFQKAYNDEKYAELFVSV